MKSSAGSVAQWAYLISLGAVSTLVFSVGVAATTATIALAQQKMILQDPGTPVLGAAHPDVVVVEYFDYNCPYCRKLAPSIQALVDNNPRVAVLFKEWPIFGGISVYAARSALAAQWQGKYLAAHNALIRAPRLSQEPEVDDALQKAGVNIAELKRTLAIRGAQIDALLSRNSSEARSLGMQGTPGLLVGRNVSTGIGDLAALQTAVAAASHTSQSK